MNHDVEYQIIVGCNDPYLNNEFVNDEELSKTIVDFFSKKETNFSLLRLNGGYSYESSNYVFENGVCVTIIGSDDEKIISLAKAFKMYMNQEAVLIVKNKLQKEII